MSFVLGTSKRGRPKLSRPGREAAWPGKCSVACNDCATRRRGFRVPMFQGLKCCSLVWLRFSGGFRVCKFQGLKCCSFVWIRYRGGFRVSKFQVL